MAEEKKSNKDSEQKPELKITRNPPELDGVPDLSQLIYLDMPNVLHNLKYRYSQMSTKFCYTSISSILLAINPYENLPIYGQDVINEFHNAAIKGRAINGRPHPYGVSARAYMRMIQRKCNQSVIVCGESGAGKTETTKLLMRYLAMTAPISPDKDNLNQSSIEEQIIAASPILEAYGNAKTVMNNNSSRFGKFTKLLYNVPANSQRGNILGSSLETYLLEKSRVVFQALNERNYHIFYFLHEGLGINNDKFGLSSIENFSYTNAGKCFIPFKDKERFKELEESLSMFRFDKNVQEILWKLTAGVLNLGNINFVRTGDGFTDIDSKSMKYIFIVSKLWGLKPSELEKRLTTQSLKVNRNDIIQKIQFDKAVSNRDSISKGIYENIFLWLCKRINAELLDDNDDNDSIDDTKTDEENGRYFIGILDVFGFENFYFNSLEQFCINYTNEKLQQYFNFHIIQQEQEEYLKESVFWKPLTIPDNAEYIQLIENQKIGFWILLDSACNGPSKNDTTAFMQTLFNKHNKNESIIRKTKPGSGNWRGEKPRSHQNNRRRGGIKPKFDGFMIEHFADNVTYDITNFLIKNTESVHSDTNKMIKKSSEPIFKEINDKKGGNRRRGGRNRRSVTAVFYSGIKRLMKSLNKTEPYFVRCINPNKEKSSKIWTESIVEHQLRCGGLLEALRVLKLGYPTRVPYKLLFEKYHSSVTNPLIKNMNPSAFSTSLLIAFDVNENDYELGLTKIFFKPSKAAILDTIMSKAGQPLSKEQNDKITKYIVGKRINQLFGTVKSFINLQKLIRMKRATKEWQKSGRIASIIGGTVCKHLKMARKQIKERKEKQAAISIQTYFRSMYERRDFIKHCSKIKKSTKIIWISYNSMKQRQGLIQWLDRKIEERKIENKRIEDMNAAKAAKEIAEKKQKEAEISKEEQLKILRKEREEEKNKEDEAKRIKNININREKEEEEKRLRDEIEARKLKQKRGSEDADKKKKELALKKKEEFRRNIEEKEKERKRQDDEAKERAKKEKKKKNRKKYKRYNDDDDDDDDDDSDTDNEYVTDPDDDEEEKEEIEDIRVLLTRFHKIAAMGQLFYRHAGSKKRNKPQDRVVKVSFDYDGKPMEISWGSGSRHIFFKDIMYISWGHYTPTFESKKDNKLDARKCFSIVGCGGDKILDLEGYSEHITELWVKGLRKLHGDNDDKSDKMAVRNFKNLMDNISLKKNEKVRDKRKITDVMRLQKDLFVMSTHTVFRHLEEERIWNIDDEIRNTFNPQQMYPLALKQDIPWRQWQHWIREQITTYLRDNNGVNTNYNIDKQSGNIYHSNSNIMVDVAPPAPFTGYHHNQYHHHHPSQHSMYINNQQQQTQQQQQQQQQQQTDGNIVEDEKCSLM